MILRLSKTALVGAVAFFYTLVVFNNLTDYGSNYAFVHHVLLMDTTFPGNHGMWRAIDPLWMHAVFYDGIIAWETVTMLLLWAGAWKLVHAADRGEAFQEAKTLAIGGLTASLLMWLVAFLSVGGEWFLMWQSHTWNGQDAAFRMFVVVGMIFLLLAMPEERAEG
jgi:predicted small integral membrane protein